LWWCCIPDAERQNLRATAEALVLTLGIGLPKDIWDALWVTFGVTDAERIAAWLPLYHAEIVTIEDAETPYEAVTARSGWGEWWAEIALWLLNVDSGCADGCPQSQRPVM